MLATDRLTLIQATEEQASSVTRYYSRNKSFHEKWVPYRTQDFYSEDYQRKKLTDSVKLFSRDKEFRFFLYEKEDQELIIGEFCISNIICDPLSSGYLGYSLDSGFTKCGYMNEALSRGIDFFFHEKKFHRLEANIIPGNKKSIALIERLGFKNEGLSKEYLKINNAWQDHLRFALLSSKS